MASKRSFKCALPPHAFGCKPAASKTNCLKTVIRDFAACAWYISQHVRVLSATGLELILFDCYVYIVKIFLRPQFVPYRAKKSASITKTNHTNLHRADVDGKCPLLVEFELKLECDKYQLKNQNIKFHETPPKANAQLHADK